MGKDGLTAKQTRLIRGLVQGKSATQAALEAGYGKGINPGSAASIASETLKKPKVQNALEAALDRAGASLNKSAKAIAEAHNATKIQSIGFKVHETPDHKTRLAAADLNMRARGFLNKAEGISGDVVGIAYFLVKGRQERGLPPIEIEP